MATALTGALALVFIFSFRGIDLKAELADRGISVENAVKFFRRTSARAWHASASPALAGSSMSITGIPSRTG